MAIEYGSLNSTIKQVYEPIFNGLKKKERVGYAARSLHVSVFAACGSRVCLAHLT
jgi:hypothetical protein